jgi:hypothetical protein
MLIDGSMKTVCHGGSAVSPTLLEFFVLFGLGVLLTAYGWALYKTLRMRNLPEDAIEPDIENAADEVQRMSAIEGESERVK